MAKGIKPKPKKCTICSSEFLPWSSTQKVCSQACAAIHGKQVEEVKAAREKRKQEKLQRDDLRRRREKLKGKPEWNREAQAAVNKFIFWRD